MQAELEGGNQHCADTTPGRINLAKNIHVLVFQKGFALRDFSLPGGTAFKKTDGTSGGKSGIDWQASDKKIGVAPQPG